MLLHYQAYNYGKFSLTTDDKVNLNLRSKNRLYLHIARSSGSSSSSCLEHATALGAKIR